MSEETATYFACYTQKPTPKHSGAQRESHATAVPGRKMSE